MEALKRGIKLELIELEPIELDDDDMPIFL
jgi:hypothetical protein